MQSKYFNPAFNSAIFDGPLRIYFAQFHESLALKIYFLIQQKLKEELQEEKEKQSLESRNLLIMIYPTSEAFEMSFKEAPKEINIVSEAWLDDQVVGLRGAIEDSELEALIEKVRTLMQQWPKSAIRAESFVESP
jgi:hypothetical protein